MSDAPTNTTALREKLVASPVAGNYEGKEMVVEDVELLDELPALLNRLEELEEAARWRDVKDYPLIKHLEDGCYEIIETGTIIVRSPVHHVDGHWIYDDMVAGVVGETGEIETANGDYTGIELDDVTSYMALVLPTPPPPAAKEGETENGKMQRICWEAPNGATGHGDWHEPLDAQAGLEYIVPLCPTIRHWLETITTPAGKEGD